MRQQNGFTLIELMLVAAIIAIVVTFAIPAYQSFTVRSRLTEVINLAARDTKSLSELHSASGTWPTHRPPNISRSSDSDYLRGVSYAIHPSYVQLSYHLGNLEPDMEGKSFVFRIGHGVVGNYDWQCLNSVDNPMPSRYLPLVCR